VRNPKLPPAATITFRYQPPVHIHTRTAVMGTDLVASVATRAAPERGDLRGHAHDWHG
jgi:hypothetical protein